MKHGARRTTTAAGLLLLLLVSWAVLASAPAHAATGTILREFIPGGATGNGRGMAFDGTHLYYTVVDNANIYKITTSGVLVATIPVEQPDATIKGGPLAWDGSALWTMNYGSNSFTLYKVNPANGSILSSCNIATQNPTHAAVTSTLNIGNFPDGLDWTGSTLWVSSEVDVGNWVVEVNTSCTILKAFNPPATEGTLAGFTGTNFGTSGVVFDGTNLWHSNAHGVQYQTNLSGVRTGLSTFTNDRQLEDLAFDNVTFSGKCALWANEATNGTNRITAYEIPCSVTTVTSISPNTILQFQIGVIEINGTGFQPGATADLGFGIQVESVQFVSATKLNASVQASPSTNCSDFGGPGSSSLNAVKVTNPDGSFDQKNLLTLVADSDGDGVPDNFNGVTDNCPCDVNPNQDPVACADVTHTFITADQTVPNSGTPFVQNEAVFVDVQATFGAASTYAFFPLAPWNVFHKVTDITGSPVELEPRIFEVGISFDDVQFQNGTADITSRLLVNLTERYTFEPGRTYQIETFVESRVNNEPNAPDQHCLTPGCPPILAYHADVPPQTFTFQGGTVPNVDGKLTVDPLFWDPTWETTPTGGSINVFYGDLTQFDVTNIAVSSVRLFGTLAPTSSEILSKQTGFSGRVLHLTFNKTDAFKALRAWLGHKPFDTGQELILLTGRLTTNGQSTGAVIGVFSDNTTVRFLPVNSLDALIAKVQNSTLEAGLKNSLLVKLFDAKTNLQSGKTKQACDKLQDFISAVMAQRGKGIAPAQADEWIADATRIRSALQCS